MMKTHSGINFNINSPKVEDIDIRDIAVSLSKQCRFNGHCHGFYSVAQHSLLVSDYCENKLWGLLHDAAEAYIGDIVSPVKRQLQLVSNLEQSILRLIAQKYNLPWPMPLEIVWVDKRMYDTEARDLMGMTGGQPYLETIMPFEDYKLVRDTFLRRFRELI